MNESIHRLQRMGFTVLKVYVVMAAGMYMLITMLFTLEFLVTRAGAGWGLDRAIEYALLWPTRVI